MFCSDKGDQLKKKIKSIRGQPPPPPQKKGNQKNPKNIESDAPLKMCSFTLSQLVKVTHLGT